MARRKSRYLTMVVHKHGLLWWLLVGWWWRPIQYLFWIFCVPSPDVDLRSKRSDNYGEVLSWER